MKKELVATTFRIPVGLRDRINRTAEELHMSGNSVAIHALRAGLRIVRYAYGKKEKAEEAAAVKTDESERAV